MRDPDLMVLGDALHNIGRPTLVVIGGSFNATGVQDMPAAAYEASGERLATTGYVMK